MSGGRAQARGVQRACAPRWDGAICARPAALAVAALAVLAGLAAPPARAQPSFEGLGDLPGGTDFSGAQGVSGDGRVAVGFSLSASGLASFRWEDGVMSAIDPVPGGSTPGLAYDANQDGSVVVGFSRGPFPGAQKEAYFATVADGTVSIHEGATASEALGVNADGTVIVGKGLGNQGFIWSQETGAVPLGDIAGGPEISEAYAVSDDGTIVAGTGRSARQPAGEAFRWTEAGGFEPLGDLPGSSLGGEERSAGLDISGDGLAVVGQGDSDMGKEAFLWREGRGMIGLGNFGGPETCIPKSGLGGATELFCSIARGTNADGSVVTGSATGFDGEGPFIWDAKNGLRNLRTVLEEEFDLADALAGWTLSEGWALSDDGRTVVGQGWNPQGALEGFIAVLAVPEPRTAWLGASALAAVFFVGRRSRRPRTFASAAR